MKKQLITLFASLFLITNAYALEFGVGVSGSLAMVDAGGTETEAGNTGAEASLRTKNVDAITPVGSIYAEAILDSGWALGRVSQTYGGNSTGKTLLAIEAAANFHRQYNDGLIVYGDFRH